MRAPDTRATALQIYLRQTWMDYSMQTVWGPLIMRMISFMTYLSLAILSVFMGHSNKKSDQIYNRQQCDFSISVRSQSMGWEKSTSETVRKQCPLVDNKLIFLAEH